MTTHGSKLKLRRLRYHENSVKHVNLLWANNFLVRHLIFKKSNDPKTRHIYLSMPLELGQSEFEKAFKWCQKAEVRKLWKPMNWHTLCVCPWFPKYAPIVCSPKKYEKPPSPSKLKMKNFWGLWSISRLFSLHFLYNSLLKHTPTIFDSIFLHKSRASVPASISSSLVLRFGKYRYNLLAIIYTHLNYSL